MKRLINLTLISLFSIQSFGQMIMSASGVNPENVCKPNTVYFLTENRAKPLEPFDSIEFKLNDAIKFAIENPTFEGKAAIQFAVNCQGQVGGGFHVVTKSGNDSLDNKLIDFFKTIKNWQAGKIRKKTVDSWYMWRLEIKNGRITVLNK
jgi:hypothetical protein